MTKQLRSKTDAVLKAIRELHSDKSGPARDNLDAFREVIETAREIEAALEQDSGEPE